MYGIAVVEGCPPPYFSVYRLRGMFSVKLSRSFTLKLWSILPNQVIAGSLIGLKRLRQPMWPMEVGASRSWFGQFCVGVRVGYFDMYAFAMGPAPSLQSHLVDAEGEERLVLEDRPVDFAAELVPDVLRLGAPLPVLEEVRCVERAVTVEFVDHAVEPVGTRPL